MNKKIEDLEKSMKRSNDKQLKIEHELCERVGHRLLLQFCLIAMYLLATLNVTENEIFFIGNLGFISRQVIKHLQDGKDVRLGDWKAADIEILNTFQLLTAKSVVYLVWVLVHLHALSICQLSTTRNLMFFFSCF